MKELHKRAWRGLIVVTICMALALFLSAGTIAYWYGWIYLGIYASASVLITLYLMKYDPALLERRIKAGPSAEKHGAQKMIAGLAFLAYIASFILPALDYRLHWSHVPWGVVLLGDVLTALSFYIVFLVFRENSFAAATVSLAPDQKVIATGPYAIVRHPMYIGVTLLFIATPLALGSFFGLLIFLVALPVFIWRLIDEEKFLREHLNGYAEYCTKVRWRLLPGVF